MTEASSEDPCSHVPDVDPGVGRRREEDGSVGGELAADDPRQMTFEDVKQFGNPVAFPSREERKMAP